jgi:hypothetical protein
MSLIWSFNYILYNKGCVGLKTCIYFIRYRLCSASGTTSHPLVTQGDGHPRTVCTVPPSQTLLFYPLCPINVKACFVGREKSVNATLQLIWTADCWKAVSASLSPNHATCVYSGLVQAPWPVPMFVLRILLTWFHESHQLIFKYVLPDFSIALYFTALLSFHTRSKRWLRAGRSRLPFPMVWLEFFIDMILPVALWPWGRLSL